MLTVAAVLAAAGIAWALLFNSLVRAKHKVAEGWSGIDVQLKRRHDLIPKLVDTVKAHAAFERGLLERVVEARTRARAVADGHVAEQGRAERGLDHALHRLLAVAEQYPDLKASASYIELQREISETEDQIAASRRIYNGNVNVLNVRVNSFPWNVVANAHGFAEAEWFELE